MSKSIISVPTNYSLKNKDLIAYTDRICKHLNTAQASADRTMREVSKILARVSDERCYKDDGFDSVSDYAEKVFGVKRATAYAMATAGHIYLDKGAPDALKALPYSKIAAMSSVSRPRMYQDATDGKIGPSSTQDELKAYAAFVRAETKTLTPTIADQYRVFFTQKLIPSIKGFDTSRPHTIVEIDDIVGGYVAGDTGNYTVEEISARKETVAKGEKTVTRRFPRRLYFGDGGSLVVELEKVQRAKAAKPTVPSPGAEQVLSGYSEAQLMAALKALRMKEQGEKIASDLSK